MTFGGGRTIEYGSRSGFGSEWKNPRSTHHAYHRCSAARGSYWGGMSVR